MVQQAPYYENRAQYRAKQDVGEFLYESHDWLPYEKQNGCGGLKC